MEHFTFNSICRKVLIVAACAMLLVSTVQAQDWSGNIHGQLGNKNLDENDWGNFDNQVELGASFDFKMNDWPLSLTIGTLISIDTESDNGNYFNEESGTTIETHIGIRKIFDIGNSPIKPYVGGGLALVFAELERRRLSSFFTDTDDDAAIGYWIGTGVYWNIIKKLNIGFDIRYSEAEVTLFNNDIKAGGLHTGLTAGYHW